MMNLMRQNEIKFRKKTNQNKTLQICKVHQI